MLLGLDIKNIALIEKLNIEISEGMTVLTGETGSGKTMIFDGISIALFGKAGHNTSWHRQHEHA